MSDDWKPGDLALCPKVYNTGRKNALPGHSGLRPGGIYLVEAVVPYGPSTALVFGGHYTRHPSQGWLSTCFRKIAPLTESEREEALRELRTPHEHRALRKVG